VKKKISTHKGKTTAKILAFRFNQGKEILDYFNVENKIIRINLDIPEWAIHALDKEAERRGVTRQSLIKIWLIDKLDDFDKKAG
jgi:predicted DNA binding CopG/RHH family protein